MFVLVTGSDGFLGKNLRCRLEHLEIVELGFFTRGQSLIELDSLIEKADIIFHLAGENRSKNERDFYENNVQLTKKICECINSAAPKKRNLIFSSSTKVFEPTPYGESKLAAENELEKLSSETDTTIYNYRLPGVFGKWSKPNYNSVVATFAFNIGRNLPIEIRDPEASVRLVYVDHVIESFLTKLAFIEKGFHQVDINPQIQVTLRELADYFYTIKEQRATLHVGDFSKPIYKSLYSTFLSFLPQEEMTASQPVYSDERGLFSEFIRSSNGGQISFLTIKPGHVRGRHFHHTKTEKFVVISGVVRFDLVEVSSLAKHQIIVSNDDFMVLETWPGWAHQLTNIGKADAVVLVWSNECYEPSAPDTFAFDGF